MKTDYRANGNDFTKGSIGSAIMHMSIPMTLAQLVNVMYSIVDRMYIGHIPNIGSLALTGIGVSTPILTIISAFSVLSGAGGASLCAIARGEGNTDKAERYMGCSLSVLLIFSAIVTLIAQIFLKPLLFLFGASEFTYPFASEYTRIYTSGTVFVMLSLGMNYYINAQGFSAYGMLTVIIGAAINLLLDPLFIFVFKMGVSGAALATLISQASSAVFVMSFLLGRKVLLKLRLKNMRLSLSTAAEIISMGLAHFIMNVTNCLVAIVCNVKLRQFGGDVYLGAMTIISSIREVIQMITHGLMDGTQPVLGYNYGARAYNRVKNGIKFTSAVVSAYSLCSWAALIIFTKPLIMLFNSEPELINVTEHAIRIYFFGFVFMGLQCVGQCVYVSLGKTRYAITFSVLRKVIVVIPLVYILPIFFGTDGVFLSEPISDILGGLACYTTMYLSVYRKLN